MQLLLRYLGVHAAVSTLLRAPLRRPDAADTNPDIDAYADSDCQRMQPGRTRLPFRDNVQLLLREMGMPAARGHLLFDRL